MNILSVSDEGISQIFQSLQAFDTSGTFNAPRHAFALAQTNKRFLRIFRELLTRITPGVSNDNPRTLAPSHILSVVRLVGHNLRELHLPRRASACLPEVLENCSRLNKLFLIESEEDRKVTFAIQQLLALPLRSLSIQDPTKRTLELLSQVTPPEELALTNVSENQIIYVVQILRNALKKLHLDIMDGQMTHRAELLTCLHDVCPKVDEVSVSAFRYLSSRRDPPFLREAIPLLEQPRYNTESKCTKMSLEGNVMELIKHAHPNAILEITHRKTTYLSNQDGVFPKRIHLEYGWLSHEALAFTLTQSLSRLEEVHLGNYTITRWIEPLLSLRLERVSIDEKTTFLWGLSLRVNTVSIRSEFLDGRVDWDWLVNAKTVEVITPPDAEKRQRQMLDLQDTRRQWNFFISLISLLRKFKGLVLWTDFCDSIPVKRESLLVTRVVKSALQAVDSFEARGGDAGTVRALLECIESR